MSDPIVERFTRIVREMDAELTAAAKEIADLKSKLRTSNFPTEQATNCGKCSQHKHTPWRDEGYGYVCATCLVEIKDEEIAEAKAFEEQLMIRVREGTPIVFEGMIRYELVKTEN